MLGGKLYRSGYLHVGLYGTVDPSQRHTLYPCLAINPHLISPRNPYMTVFSWGKIMSYPNNLGFRHCHRHHPDNPGHHQHRYPLRLCQGHHCCCRRYLLKKKVFFFKPEQLLLSEIISKYCMLSGNQVIFRIIIFVIWKTVATWTHYLCHLENFTHLFTFQITSVNCNFVTIQTCFK